jgi:hypothetical protein
MNVISGDWRAPVRVNVGSASGAVCPSGPSFEQAAEHWAAADRFGREDRVIFDVVCALAGAELCRAMWLPQARRERLRNFIGAELEQRQRNV